MVELIANLLTPVAQVALIMGIAEAAKKAGMQKRFIPLLDLFLGVVIGIVVNGIILRLGIAIGAVIGVACGLSACGLFSGVKNVIAKKDDSEEADQEQDTKDGEKNV